MLMTCHEQTNSVLCRKCDVKYHCRSCFESHQTHNWCGVTQVEKLLGKDKELKDN